MPLVSCWKSEKTDVSWIFSIPSWLDWSKNTEPRKPLVMRLSVLVRVGLVSRCINMLDVNCIQPHFVSPPEDTNSKKPNQQTSTQRHQHQERSSLSWRWHRTRSELQEWATPTKRSWRHHCRKKRERSQCGLPTEAEELRGVVWELKQALLGHMGSPHTLGHATQTLQEKHGLRQSKKRRVSVLRSRPADFIAVGPT